jgi:hypothetical protein
MVILSIGLCDWAETLIAADADNMPEGEGLDKEQNVS